MPASQARNTRVRKSIEYGRHRTSMPWEKYHGGYTYKRKTL